MKERAKSFILVLLVLLSLLLTYQLWFGQKPVEEITEDVYEPVFFEEPRALTGMITPRRILLYRDEALFQLGPGEAVFQVLWDGVSALLQDLTSLAQQEHAEEPPAAAFLGLTVQFTPPLPTGPGSPWLAENGSRELSELSFWRLEDQFWAAFQESGVRTHRFYKLSGVDERFLRELDSVPLPAGKVPCRQLEAGDLSAALGIEVSVEHNLYVPAGEVFMPELILKQELLDRQALLQTFFVDHSLVRVISERDGGLIYTDGEKGLRLSGGLDFSHPQLEHQWATLTYPAALHSAGKYLAYYGGWPDWLHLVELARIRPARAGREVYRSSWSGYYEGYPFVDDSGVRMFFNDGGLVEYQRHLYEPLYPATGTIAVAGHLDALRAAVAQLQELDNRPEGALKLEALALKYGVDLATVPPRGIPVWLVRLNGVELMLEAGDLTLLKELAP